MSRNTIHSDERIKAYKGSDPMLGDFIQVFDLLMKDETPDNTGLVFSINKVNGVEVNLTGLCVSDYDLDYNQLVTDYIVQNMMYDDEGLD